MGLGYSLFVKPLLVVALAFTILLGLYLLPEYWPDHAAASEAILQNDSDKLALYLARGLAPEDRAQWRSYFRRTFGRATRVGVGDSLPDYTSANESLLSYALSTCTTFPARHLVAAGADASARNPGQWTLLGLAAACGDADLVASMLEHGANPNADEPDGGTVLWEPTNVGWRRRPFDEAIGSALVRRGAVQPTLSPVRR